MRPESRSHYRKHADLKSCPTNTSTYLAANPETECEALWHKHTPDRPVPGELQGWTALEPAYILASSARINKLGWIGCCDWADNSIQFSAPETIDLSP